MRISDWSSDVCSSDLLRHRAHARRRQPERQDDAGVGDRREVGEARMMPLWLDMLRTPMAAPETIRLRVMRLAWLSLCVALAGSVILLEPLPDHLGKAAPCIIALLLGAALTPTLVHLRAKTRGDAAPPPPLGRGNDSPRSPT